jgi:hypothetical protein
LIDLIIQEQTLFGTALDLSKLAVLGLPCRLFLTKNQRQVE